MKTTFCFLLLIFCVNSFCFSQTLKDSVNSRECSCPPDNDYAFITVETVPEFPGGEKARMEFLMENLKWPQTNASVQGTVFIAFCVEKDGSISGVKVARGIHRLFDEEALRVVQAMPNWKPATQRGRPICTPFVMPIRFVLEAPIQESIDEQQKTTPRRRNRNRN